MPGQLLLPSLVACHNCCKEPDIAKQGFITELSRRNVFRVGAAYAVVGWLLVQIADVLFPLFGAPDWALRIFVIALLLGLPIALLFAWVFELTPEGVKREKDLDRSTTRSTGRKLDLIIIGVLTAAVAWFAVDKFIWQSNNAQPTAQPSLESDTDMESGASKRSIAVLPFVNMSTDPENEYFADGLSEELLNQLAQIPDLQVVGRTSSFSFKGKNEDLRVIGNALNVANLLEGSVRRQGDKVRVTAQLIRVDDGFHLWSNSYDRTMDDVFVIQDDIASNVAGALKIVLDEKSRERMQHAGVRNVDAFVEFQKGQALFELAHSGSELMEYLRQGIVHFDRAIELVPEFAAAHWQKSDYYAHVILEPTSSNDERAIALRDLNEALEIVYRLSEDPSRRAMVNFDRVLFSDDWTPLQDRIEKALAATGCSKPNWIELAANLGYAESARKLYDRFQRCEPLSMTTPLKRAIAHAYLGDFEKALAVLDEAEVLLGSNAWIAGTRHWVLLAQGRYEEALAIAPEVSVDVGFFGMSAKALPLAMSGDIEGARAAMEEWQAENGRNLRNEIEIHAAIGDREQANRLAAELDAKPGGPMTLLLTTAYCSCGAPFDLEATPRFRERITESGLAWPSESLIHYPAKDW
jgi:TolB-like protein/tetratricopeptide (TPR) repeat protein